MTSPQAAFQQVNDMETKLQLVREELSASKSQVSRSGYTEEEPLQFEHPMLTKAQTRNDKLEHDILAVDPKIKRLRSQFREGVEEGFTKAVMQILSLAKKSPNHLFQAYPTKEHLMKTWK